MPKSDACNTCMSLQAFIYLTQCCYSLAHLEVCTDGTQEFSMHKNRPCFRSGRQFEQLKTALMESYTGLESIKQWAQYQCLKCGRIHRFHHNPFRCPKWETPTLVSTLECELCCTAQLTGVHTVPEKLKRLNTSHHKWMNVPCSGYLELLQIKPPADCV